MAPIERDIAQVCADVYPRLVGALGLVAGPTIGEELAQEALVRLWQHWRRVRTYDNPEAWTLRVGLNLATSHFRRRRVERRSAERAQRVVPTEGIDRVDDHLLLVDALGSLTPRQRSAVVLRYYSDLSIEQTANVMGCAPGTVKALSHQGLATLHDILGIDVEIEGTDA